MTDRVVGLMMARSEWPLVLVSIVHVLENFADEVVVVDHSSSDQTAQGLTALEKLYPGRLHRLFLGADGYFQKTTIQAALRQVDKKKFAWVYAFDADEFAVTRLGFDLRKFLSGLDASVGAVQYSLRNWAVMSDGTKFEPGSPVPEILHRVESEEKLDVSYSPEKYARVVAGVLGILELTWPDKIIIRTEHFSSLTAGAHRSTKPINVVHFAEGDFEVAHVPFANEMKITERIETGRVLQADGFAISHTWQNQAIYELSKVRDVKWIWQRMSSFGLDSQVVEDRTLHEAIEPAVELLRAQGIFEAQATSKVKQLSKRASRRGTPDFAEEFSKSFTKTKKKLKGMARRILSR